MKLSDLRSVIEDVKVLELDQFEDQRGVFMEVYNHDKYIELGLPSEFYQSNQALSYGGVVRGMHIQGSNPQGKLIKCIYGTIYDAFVDLRKDSPTFGKWDGMWLDWKNPKAIYLPPGIAHGYYTASAVSMLSYHCTTMYDAYSDGGILYNDPDVGIEWPFGKDFVPIVSLKDMKLLSLQQIKERYEQLHR